jgi:hypothetical protein
VALRVHADALRQILRLPDDMVIRNADAELYATAEGAAELMVVLTVDVGDRAPAGTVDMAPAYERAADVPDPIRLREVCWTSTDGEHVIQRIEA